MNRVILIVASFSYSIISFAQNKKDLNIGYMLRGCIYAQSSVSDSLAPGGFAESDNVPKKIHGSLNFSQRGFFMKLDTSRIVTFAQDFNGYTLFMVNKSDTVVDLKASDSRLYVIAEVYHKDKWQPIEYLPSSWCGNSYHRVYLKQNEYWTFAVPKFAGKIKTKLRYRLALDGGQFIYSNEITAYINQKQLTEKQEHTPNGIMDPYNE